MVQEGEIGIIMVRKNVLLLEDCCIPIGIGNYVLKYPRLPKSSAKQCQKTCAKFTGNNSLSGENHLKSFQSFIEDFELWDEDVAMKYFMPGPS